MHCHSLKHVFLKQSPFLRLFSQTVRRQQMRESVITEKVVQGQKSHQYDSVINALLDVQEARKFYYTQMTKLQDHHFIMLIGRLQQMVDLKGQKMEAAKRKTCFLLTEKLEQKIITRIPHLDCEDVLQLVRYISKLKNISHQAKVEWVQNVMIKLAERLTNPSFLEEARLLYRFENWFALMININLIYGNVIIASGFPLIEGEQGQQSLKESNQRMGEMFCDEVKRQFLSPSASGSTDENQLNSGQYMQLYDQLSRFSLESYSVIKELQNRLIPMLSTSNHTELLTFLHIMTRISIQPDQKTLNLMQKITRHVNESIDKLTYAQIAQYLESLLILDFKPQGEDFSKQIIKELEARQKQLYTTAANAQDANNSTTSEKDVTTPQSDKFKLQIQDSVKLYRSLFQLPGCQHDLNQSSILLRAFTNLVSKSKDKMTTNQLTEVQFMVRQAMLYPVSSHISGRLMTLYNDVRDELEKKVFKINVQRLMVMLLQDYHLKDTLKLVKPQSQESSSQIKQFKSNMLKSILHHIDELHYTQEVNLITQQLFSRQNYEEGKFIGIALSEINQRQKSIREKKLSGGKPKLKDQEDIDRDLLSINKLIYLICQHEAASALANQITPQFIQSREQWTEIAQYIKSLKAIGVYDSYKKDDFYAKEVGVFQKVILEDKFDITGYAGEEVKDVESQTSQGKLERVKQSLQEVYTTGEIDVKKPIELREGHSIFVDILIPEKKLAFKVLDQVKIPHDTRFSNEKSILESNKILLLGDENYTLKRQVMQSYNEASKSSLQAYYLRYFKGFNLKVLDAKRAQKDQNYIKQLFNQ